MSSEPSHHCPHAEFCPLFARFGLDSSSKVWSSFYCEARFEECKRYRLSSANKPVPELLLPNGKTLKK